MGSFLGWQDRSAGSLTQCCDLWGMGLIACQGSFHWPCAWQVRESRIHKNRPSPKLKSCHCPHTSVILGQLLPVVLLLVAVLHDHISTMDLAKSAAWRFQCFPVQQRTSCPAPAGQIRRRSGKQTLNLRPHQALRLRCCAAKLGTAWPLPRM